MSYFNQCDNCKGQKRLMGFGMIWQDCPVCNATGFKQTVGSFVNATTPKIEPKKKGRSKKAKE